MITKRVVEKAKKPIKWQSRLFTVPKKGTDKLRIILDLSHLNKFIQCPTFKMLTLREVKMLLPQHHFTASLDLKDGYWHVPITPKKRPYLGLNTIQSHAIRSEYRSKNRRPTDSFSFLPSIPTTSSDSNRDFTILEMDYQREEVKDRTSTSVPMVGSQMALDSFQQMKLE